MKLARFQLFIFLLLFGLVLTAKAQACSCSAPATIAEAFKKSSAVFRGRVVKISIPSLDWLGVTRTGAHRVKFEILKQWKGTPTETAVVITRITGEECGFPFEEQKEYLVFVIEGQKHIQTGICTGTKAAADADGEIQELDQLIVTPSP